ncbi:MAG: hypothetical protein Q9168_004859 [Polycauliona sp. 1 TL-2023]
MSHSLSQGPAAPTALLESQRWTNPLERRHVRLKYARLQYRGSSDLEWKQLDEGYVDDQEQLFKKTHLEPSNLEQVCFRQGAIEVSQFRLQYDGRDPKEYPRLPAQYQWKVVFTDLSDIVMSETTVPYKTAAGKEYTEKYCAVRFRYRCPPECTPLVRESTMRAPRTVDEIAPLTATVVGDGDKSPEGGEVASDDGGVEAGDEEAAGEATAGEAADEDEDEDDDDDEEQEDDEEGEEGDEEDKTDPATLPLAKVFPKEDPNDSFFEVRLAHKKGLIAERGAGKSLKGFWAWPMVIRFLADQGFVHHPKKEDLGASLDHCAEGLKNLLRAFTLVKRPTTTEAGSGATTDEWQFLPKMNELQQKAATFTIPEKPGFTFHTTGSRPVVPPSAPSLGNKGKFEDMADK